MRRAVGSDNTRGMETTNGIMLHPQRVISVSPQYAICSGTCLGLLAADGEMRGF